MGKGWTPIHGVFTGGAAFGASRVLILSDTATIIPPPEICRKRTEIARSKGPEPLPRVTMRLRRGARPCSRRRVPRATRCQENRCRKGKSTIRNECEAHQRLEEGHARTPVPIFDNAGFDDPKGDRVRRA